MTATELNPAQPAVEDTAVTATTIDTYEVTATHPALSGPLVMELIATSEKAAISRARLTAFHMYRDWALMEAAYAITGHKAGVWPDGRPSAQSCRSCGERDVPLEADGTCVGCMQELLS